MNNHWAVQLLFVFLLVVPAARAQKKDSWERVQRTGELRWGADASGGAPYVYPASDNPSKIIGFEIDVMEALAHQLKVKPLLVQVPWEELIPALERGDYDVAFNGLEITPDRKKVVLFTNPYYLFSEQITVRKGDGRFHALSDMHGFRIGTLSASLAQSLLGAERRITVVPYPSPVEAYKDLELGRTDAALFDVPIAAFYAGPNLKLENIPDPIGKGYYAGALSPSSILLKEKMDQALAQITKTGELRSIYEKWHIWNQQQTQLVDPGDGREPEEGRSIRRFIPLMITSAGMTVFLSFASMSLAVLVGFGLCLGKLFGGRLSRVICGVYIEVIRGTPLLVQLYLLYYGLPNIGIQLNALSAAILGMGFNYAAYEAEIYRAGILSVARGQDEAARSLGMTRAQGLRYVIIPQAVRTILPPSTNDFIALFKDTSLVSVITVTELTRAYNLAATTTYRFLELGLITALLYFLMSYPLSLWARHLERTMEEAR